jgi:pentatricopeptide repeat protein
MRYDLPPQQNENIKKAKALLQIIQNRKDYKPTLRTTGPYLTVLCSAGRLNRAQEFFDKMVELGVKPSLIEYTLMIKMYARSRRIGYAIQTFQQMEAKGITPDTLCYERIIRGCALNGHITQAIEYLKRLCQTGDFPTRFVMLPLIHRTKPFPDTWKEIRSALSLSRLPSHMIDEYFPRKKREEPAPLITDRSVRFRKSNPRGPMKSPKRLKPKEVIISNW